MKKKNNKGFTLVELLAVVVILLAISVIAVSSISAAIERNKVKQDEAKHKVIVSYARLYYGEHKNTINNEIVSNGYACIDIDNLELDVDEKTDSNGDLIVGYVKISNNGNTFEFVNSCS